MESTPKLGQVILDGERRRDAIHIAIAPVTAGRLLKPREHVGLLKQDDLELVGPCENNIGIVDPFLQGELAIGERFWLFLYPESITSLRHIWTHPLFTETARNIREKLR